MNYPFLVEALLELKPNTPFIIDGENELQNVTWGEGVTNIPTDQQIIDKCIELEAAEPMKVLRIERDKLLGETDWIVTRASEKQTPVSSEWQTYRQALRDLPATAEPQLNKNYDLTNITWPVKPE
tara:strand:- start:36 stop:410 length:375 start_codon:yes stop_codon:yes gene_type:complete